MADRAPRILLVDDEQPIQTLLSFPLQRDGYEVIAASDGQEALARFSEQPFDLVVLDLMLPGLDGLEVCRRVQRDRPVPVLMLTARDEEADVLVGLAVGADDYMTKPFSPRELVARVRALLRRAQTAPAPTLGFTVDGTRVSLDGVPLNLTKLELGLLTHLLRAPQRIHSRNALLDAVWGSSAESTDRTVDTHIKTLRAKLREAAPERDPIKTHRGLGYSLEP
jgi:two-component system catabolic regulation response regulator CreB